MLGLMSSIFYESIIKSTTYLYYDTRYGKIKASQKLRGFYEFERDLTTIFYQQQLLLV